MHGDEDEQGRAAVAKIVVGVDDSEHAHGALRWACAEAHFWDDPEVVVVHAWHYPYRNRRSGHTDLKAGIEADAHEALDELVATARSAAGEGVTITPSLIEESPVEALLEAARGADMLVVGSRGRGGFKAALLGSVSQQVAQHAPCPVVIIREGVLAPVGATS